MKNYFHCNNCGLDFLDTVPVKYKIYDCNFKSTIRQDEEGTLHFEEFYKGKSEDEIQQIKDTVTRTCSKCGSPIWVGIGSNRYIK